MEFYIRVAGVNEKGATDCLAILPSEAAVLAANIGTSRLILLIAN